MVTILAHSDVDGLLSLATLLQYLKEERVRAYFTSPAKLLDIICLSVMGKEKILDNFYVLDFSGKRETVTASAIYENAFWYDHHIWDSLEFKLENVKIFVEELPSTVAVLTKFLNFKNEFEKYANEIDTNNVVSKESERLRDLVSAYKNKFSGIILSGVLFQLARRLAKEGINEILNPVYDNIISEYKSWLSKNEKAIYERLRIYNKRNAKIGIVDSNLHFSVFHIFNLLKRDNIELDILIVTSFDRLNNCTKLEFRTYTNKDVLALARFFGGGGHRLASGATVRGLITTEEILRAIEIVK